MVRLELLLSKGFSQLCRVTVLALRLDENIDVVSINATRQNKRLYWQQTYKYNCFTVITNHLLLFILAIQGGETDINVEVTIDAVSEPALRALY